MFVLAYLVRWLHAEYLVSSSSRSLLHDQASLSQCYTDTHVFNRNEEQVRKDIYTYRMSRQVRLSTF